jgi:CheY-like chemotaxis protein
VARGGFFSVDSLQSVHVLVVCGDAMTGELLLSVLQYCGALCTLAGSPEEAFRRMDVLRPDVAVGCLPVDQPQGGLAFVRQLRARKPENGGTTPVVLVGEGFDAEPPGLGRPDAVLPHPVNPWDLCRVVSTLITARGNTGP